LEPGAEGEKPSSTVLKYARILSAFCAGVVARYMTLYLGTVKLKCNPKALRTTPEGALAGVVAT